MDLLNYETLKKNGYSGYYLEDAPEKVLQFGEGGFLRAFIDYFFDIMNEKGDFNGKVVITQPRGGHPEITERFANQDCLYTLILRGNENGKKVAKKRIISSISRCLDPKSQWHEILMCAENPELRFVISNTTEAGIAYDTSCKIDDAPPITYPAKLLAFLVKRYESGLDGLWILPCELNDHNGDLLRDCIEKYISDWNLSDEFIEWYHENIHICSTLVDRIVTGYPKLEADVLCEEFGYEDKLIDTAEVFGFWVIEAPQAIKDELPIEKCALPILVTDDHTPYKQRKVRILNGAHTSMVLGAYLSGQNIVRSCMENDVIHSYMNKCIYDEIIPTLDLPEDELNEFASAVTERFNNPYIDHSLLAISLNSTSKWQARVLPSVKEYYKRFSCLPKCLLASFAFYIAFYHNAKLPGKSCLVGKRGNDSYEVKDDQWILDFYLDHADDSAEEIVHAVVNNDRMWSGELSAIPEFEAEVTELLKNIESNGPYCVMEQCIS